MDTLLKQQQYLLKLWNKLFQYIKNNKYVEYTEDGRKSLLSEDSFNTNFNDWDLYTSDLSSAKLINGTFELVSFTKAGTSRYISFANNSTDITIEASFDVSKADATQKTGFLFGFKDWNNYNYFLVSKDGIYVGYVFEGISAQKTDGMFVSNFDNEKKNSLKIITYDDQMVFSVNGEVQYKCDKLPMPGSNIGFALSGKGSVVVDDLIVKEINFNADNTTIVNKDDAGIKASGSGILIAENGYIITNEHVIHDADKIQVELITNGIATTYVATLVQKDEANDLAIIKITDDKFKPLDKLKYSFKESGAIEVSAPLFTIGFPLALSGMGKEVKYTDGKASAKTGYNGALNQFQTSIPVQPGNSGGPVFTDKGELLGVICSKITKADNVSYAVKLNYIKNLVETVSEITTLPNDKSIQALTSEEKIKILSNYVTLIKIK
ncbi:MAG: serine protease [Bacteroidia bacterium]